MNEQQNVELKLIHMEDVVSKEVEWLWYPYIPYGKITIIEGDPGEGKTTLVLMLAAARSKGLPLPCDDDKAYEPIHIIYQTAEDGIDDTVKPRLERAGADCSMIRVIDETEKELCMTDVFTPETLSVILQDKLREEAGMCFRYHTHEDLSEKSLGRNHDLSVTEYKVAKETEHLEQIQEQVHDAGIELLASQIAYKELERRQTKELNEKTDAIVKKNEAMEQEYTDKKEKLESEISYLESKRNIEKSLSDMDKRESQRISDELEGKRLELQSVNQEIEYTTDKAKEAVVLLDRIKAFVSSFRLFAPTIEEYANQVEADKTIDAGNSFRGILYEIGKLLEAFKELIKEGLCWFPRLMKWNTSKGEVAPVFIEKSSGYSYSVYGYMNVETKEYYSKETIQWEIKAHNRTGTVEQMDANVEAMARDLQEILRLSSEQKRLWDRYERR